MQQEKSSTKFYGGPLDGQVMSWNGEAPDQWEVDLYGNRRRRKMRYQRYTWPTRPDRPDVFVAEGYNEEFHDHMHGDIV